MHPVLVDLSPERVNITADVKDVFQHTFSQGQFQMAGIIGETEQMIVRWYFWLPGSVSK